ncbi:carbohydrate sulfotransferase 4 [Rhinophrynus dorsalis]
MLKFGIGKLSVIVLIVTQTVSFVCIILNLHHKPPPPVKKHDRKHLIIISTWRSGSSFTGQLFSQHPDVFYLMEPAKHVWTTMHQNSATVLQMAVRDLIRSSLLCDMSVFDAYMSSDKIKSSLFQWETSRALCSPPACHMFKRNDIIPQGDCRTVCSKYPFETIEKACKTYNHIVLKEVRFFDLKVLYPLLHDPSLNLKILHLFRDPRGVFFSRQKINSALSGDTYIILGDTGKDELETAYKVMEEICKSQVEMYQTAINTNYSRLQNRYLMVRYEDIVNDPIKMSQMMYQFTDLRFTPKLKTWIYNITHGKGQGSSFVINSRDALNVSTAWRENLSFETIQKVQSVCKDAMDVLGYRHLETEEEQKNLGLSVLLPTPKMSNAKIFHLNKQ